MSAKLGNDYYVSTRHHGRPAVWAWEIHGKPKPLGVRLGESGFESEFAAKLAGERALLELLEGLASEQEASVADKVVEQPLTPTCETCGGQTNLVRRISRFAALPELSIYRCVHCARTMKRKLA
jgi:hypothetical protein